jgi:Mitochondrial import receptor subunit or translocase
MYGGGAPSAADAAKQKIAAQQTMKNFAVSVATLYSSEYKRKQE